MLDHRKLFDERLILPRNPPISDRKADESRGGQHRRPSQCNQAATGLYEKYGFRPIARRKAYYRDTGEDAIVMGVLDLASPAYDRLLEERTAARV